MSGNSFKHTTVLLDELVSALNLKEGYTAIDCTAGGGGHLALMLQKCGRKGKVYGVDRDPEAIRVLSDRFQPERANGQLELLHGPFSEMIESISGEVDAIAADFGVSSFQLDEAERGFSFMRDGPLDMRMNPEDPVSAADIIREYSAEQLAEIFMKWGEEPKARYIATAIVRERKKKNITGTLQLSEIIKNAIHYRSASRRHPATKVFQALRICVNSELHEIELLLEKAIKKLKPEGRLAVITFHSLEDRLVKRIYKKAAGMDNKNSIIKSLPLTEQELNLLIEANVRIVSPFPIKPDAQEVEKNPRSRSAKLRVLEKLH